MNIEIGIDTACLMYIHAYLALGRLYSEFAVFGR